MKPGNYQLVETQAPKGYQLDASPINFTIDKAQATPLQITVSNKKIESSSGGDDKPVTPPNKEENKGNETSEKHKNGTSEETSNETITNSKMIEIRISTFQIQVIKKILHKQ